MLRNISRNRTGENNRSSTRTAVAAAPTLTRFVMTSRYPVQATPMVATASPTRSRTTKVLPRNRPRRLHRTACHDPSATVCVRRPSTPKARTASSPWIVDRMCCDWVVEARLSAWYTGCAVRRNSRIANP